MSVIAVRGSNPTALFLSKESTLTHNTKYFLVVYRISAAVQFVGHPTVSIAGELLDNGFNLSDETRVVLGRAL